MRHILTFKSNLSESAEYDHPNGYSIGKFLKEELSRKGLDIEPLDNYRDIAWSVDCHINGKRVFFFVGYLGTRQTDWQLIVCSHAGLLKRLFGYNDENERKHLAEEIHEILSEDDRFVELKWFSRYTDKSTDEWHDIP